MRKRRRRKGEEEVQGVEPSLVGDEGGDNLDAINKDEARECRVHILIHHFGNGNVFEILQAEVGVNHGGRGLLWEGDHLTKRSSLLDELGMSQLTWQDIRII